MAVDTLARALAAGKVPVSAYEMAVKAGYTGTEEQFAEDMGNSGTNAMNAAASASAAAASAESVSASAAQIATNTSDISDLKTQINATRNGSTVKTKGQVQADYTEYSTGYIYKLDNLVIGESKLEDITTSGSGDAVAYIIPFDKATISIKYPVFKTSGNYGCFIFDSTDTILWMYAETTANTGTYKTVDIPQNATYMLFSVPNSLGQLDWNVEIESFNVADIGKEANDNTIKLSALINGYTVTKQEVNQMPNISINTVYKVDDSIGKQFSSVTTATLTGAFAKSINIAHYKFIEYTVFKSSIDYGCLMLDENDIVVWAYTERQKDTGETIRISIPQNAVRMIWTISPALSSMDYSYTLFLSPDNFNSDLFVDENKNLCLAGIKTDILTNKIPYHRGFLFHKLQNNDNSLWYGNDFANIHQIGVAEFNPTVMRFAISPKDGRIIAVQRDTRNGIWVWDGETTTHIDNFTVNPMAWLYNSGVDFIIDNNGVEHCVFAEYTSSPSADVVLNVWRGTYPYTANSDWEIVLSKTSGSVEIGHFHMIRRDPWSNALYCTSGDNDANCIWWYSTDYGLTWTQLVSGADAGWNNQICRTINFVFTNDFVYWAVDHGEDKHALYKIARDANTHLFDLSTMEKLTDLPGLFATNSICYVESPKGLFMYDRVDTVPVSNYGSPIPFKFWDLQNNVLKDVVTLGLTSNIWGGSRGKCYINYTNGIQPYPAMGFSIDTPCIFDLVCDNPSNIGTIVFEIGGVVRTVIS